MLFKFRYAVALNCDFKSNIDMYPAFQEYFYKRDLPNAQINIINGGHKALETNFDEVLELITNFLVS